MEIETKVKPMDETPIVRGRVHKKYGLRYASRTLELYEDGWLYVYIDGMDAPHCKIEIAGSSVANNSDDPSGFVVLSANRAHKHRFVCIDVQTKKTWLEHLHHVSSAAASSMPASQVSGAGRHQLGIDRSGDPAIADALLKRSGRGSYSVRWCEVWPNLGLAYAKHRDAPDDDFKTVVLEGARIVVNDEKMRVTILPRGDAASGGGGDGNNNGGGGGGGALYLRFESAQQLVKWIKVLQLESGSEWQELGGGLDDTASRYGASETAVGAEQGLDSDDELELADLESAEVIRNVKVNTHLESISREVIADRDTPGFDQVLAGALKKMGRYGFAELLDQFETRMAVPIFGPYGAVHKHVSELDLDAQHIRQYLCQLLDTFPREVKVVVVAQRANDLLLEYQEVREVFLVRRNISEFREVKGQHGLTLGVNGTIAFIANLQRAKPAEKATPGDVAKAEQMVDRLRKCLHEFRVDYDVFDDAYYAIRDMEQAIRSAREWVDHVRRIHREAAI